MSKIKNIIQNINWRDIQPHTVVSIILTILAWINMGLTTMGKPIIDIQEDTINQIVSWIFVFGTTAYGSYKNNSYTWFAQLGDRVTYALRDGKLTPEEIEQIKNIVGDKDVIIRVDSDLFEDELSNATEGTDSEQEEG